MNEKKNKNVYLNNCNGNCKVWPVNDRLLKRVIRSIKPIYIFCRK